MYCLTIFKCHTHVNENFMHFTSWLKFGALFFSSYAISVVSNGTLRVKRLLLIDKCNYYNKPNNGCINCSCDSLVREYAQGFNRTYKEKNAWKETYSGRVNLE